MIWHKKRQGQLQIKKVTDEKAHLRLDVILSKSKMSKYDPDGFRYTNIWELIELVGSPQ